MRYRSRAVRRVTHFFAFSPSSTRRLIVSGREGLLNACCPSSKSKDWPCSSSPAGFSSHPELLSNGLGNLRRGGLESGGASNRGPEPRIA
jgi:hypothetical protein